MQDGMTIYTPLTEQSTPEQLTLFQADSPVSHSASPDNEKAMKMTARSGRRCLESFEKLGRAGLLEKMLLGFSQWTTGRYSTKYSLRWKMKAIKRKRLLFQLVPSALRTDATGFGLLPTCKAPAANAPVIHGQGGMDLQTALSLIPTPLSNEGTKGIGGPNLKMKTLGRFITLIPIPAARDYKRENSAEHIANGRGHLDQLPNFIKASGENTGMRLQPAFVEWMMGFPEGWTDIEQKD